MKKRNLLLLSAAAVLGLASCGGNNDESKPISSVSEAGESLPSGESVASSTPVSSEQPTSSDSRVTTLEALNRALAADYKNMLVYSGALANEFETGEYEVYYNDYQIVYGADGDAYYQYYHDYNGESYQYFKASAAGEVSGWLKEGYNGAKVGLGNLNSIDLREVIAKIGKYKNNVRYQEGLFYIVNEKAVNEIVEDCYQWCYDVAIDTIYFTIDPATLTFSKIGGFDVDIDTDKNQVVAEITRVGESSWTGELPAAPTKDTVMEYWQYKGWSGPQVHVYPSALNVAVDPAAVKNADNAYVLEIEEGIPFEITATWNVPEGVEEARQVRHNSIEWKSTNEDIAFVGYNDQYERMIVGVSAGDAEIYAVGESADGKGIESNRIKVHVNPLAEQNLEGAVYNLKFDGTLVNGNVAATNLIENTKPFDVTVNEGVKILTGTETSANFAGANVMVMRTGQQETMNKEFAGDAVATFDFDDQQVSGISFYYGALFNNFNVGKNFCTKIALETSNDGETWTEVADITEEVKAKNSVDNLHLMERSFAPASKVRIRLDSSMIGVAYEMSMKGVAFIANAECHSHFEAPTNPVTAVNIAAANNATKVKMGQTLQINGSVSPNNASNKAIVYHVSDESVATISESGLLTPVAPGTVKVTATSAYGASEELVTSNELTITVAPADAVPTNAIATWKEGDYMANYFEVKANEVVMKFSDGGELTLPYTENDDDGYAVFGNYTSKEIAGYFKIKASSSMSNEADYTYNVNIGEKNYKANVYAVSDSLNKYIAATSMTLSLNKTTIKVGDTAFIAASFAPNGATAQNFRLFVPDTSVIAFLDEDNNEVASSDLDKQSKRIKAKGAGTVTVTATSDSGLTATLVVTVEAPVQVSAISVTLSESTIAVGAQADATALVTPTNADNKAVTWSSSAPTVASVSSTGKVTGKSAGTAEIIATAKDGSGVVGKATITVTSSAPSVALPSDLVGTSWLVDESGLGAIMTFEFVSATELSVTEADYMGFEDTFTLVSKNGNVYRLENADADVMYLTIDGDSITVIVNNGNNYGDYALDNAELYQE